MISRFSALRRRRSKNKRRTQRVQFSRSLEMQFEALEVRCLLTASTVSATLNALTELLSPRYQLTTAAGATPLASSAPVGLTPAQIRHAYGIDQILFDGGIVGDGAGQTIAIVDAYHSPTVFADLQVFDSTFHIADPPSFRQVAQDGSTNFPSVDPAGAGAADGTWELETALDVEWAHAIAPAANILLVEADSSSFSDLVQAAVNYARSQPGVIAVSMSFGSDEFSGETSNDTYFTTPAGHTGVTFLAATGDDGQPGGYPAYSQNVVAVGGATLSTNSSGAYLGETGWSGSGGGTSTIVTQPGYQSDTVTQSTTRRANPDVAFDADPNSGVAIYDSYDFGAAGWIQIGGTSFSTPAWAGLIAIADQGRSLLGLSSLDGRTETLPDLYQLPASDFNDITSGNNGFAAGAGYDLVTGRGTPKANLVVGGLIGSTISGVVYSDANNDGLLDAGETGLGGWTVYDDVNNDGVFTPASQLAATSTDVPVTIPDLKTITSTITVSGATGTIGDLNVNLTLHHTYDSDLVITLISPTGKTVTLANKNGGSGDNFLGTIFDDQATTSISSGSAAFAGSFRPISSLATLNGDDLNGVWTLQIADTVRRDSGTLNSWSLDFTTGSDIAVTSAADGSYKFVDVAPGEHHIREAPQADFAETQPASGVYNLTVAVGASIKGKDLGNYQAPPPPPPNTVFPAGDFNRDHMLTSADVHAMLVALTDLAAYQTANSLSDAALLATGDLNNDGSITNADMQPLLAAIAAAETQATASTATSNATAAVVTSTNSATGSATVATSTSVAANSVASTETLSDTTSVAHKKITKAVRHHSLASNLTSKQTAAVDHALETAFDFRHSTRWLSLVDRVSHTNARAGAALKSVDAIFDRIIARV
jgi:subtilisin-like proprotein convertase family protein